MQIQLISNNYQARSQSTQRIQKQNTPSFTATIKPENAHVFGRVIETLDRLIATKPTGKHRFQKMKQRVTEVMGCLMDHNNNHASHLRVSSSSTIPIVRAKIFSGNVVWLDSADPEAINNLSRTSEIDDALTGISLTMRNGKKYGFAICGKEIEEDAKQVAKIQADAIEIYQARPDTAYDYNQILLTGGKIEGKTL